MTPDGKQQVGCCYVHMCHRIFCVYIYMYLYIHILMYIPICIHAHIQSVSHTIYMYAHMASISLFGRCGPSKYTVQL